MSKIQQYQRNKKEICKNYDTKHDLIKKIRQERQDAHYRWEDKIYKLKSKQSTEDLQFNKKIENAENKLEGERNELNIVIKDVDRTIWFLEIQRKNRSRFPTFDLKQVRGRTNYGDRKPIKLIEEFDDGISKIGLFVVENNRPANKYNLVVMGYTPFTQGAMQGEEKGVDTRLMSSWTADCEWDYPKEHKTTVEYDLKFFKTKKDAEEYAKKGLRNIFKKFFTEYDQVFTDYNNAVKNHQIEEFAKLREAKAIDQYANHYGDSDGTAKNRLVEEMKTIRRIDVTEAKKLLEKARAIENKKERRWD